MIMMRRVIIIMMINKDYKNDNDEVGDENYNDD